MPIGLDFHEKMKTMKTIKKLFGYFGDYISFFKKKSKLLNSLFVGIFFLTILFRLWLILGIPKFYIYAPHDDLYYAKIANHLIHGDWLGPYDNFTLIKPPFYAFFLAFSFYSGLPLLVNENIFYLLSCIALFFAVKPLIQSRWLRFVLFSIILFLPISLTSSWALRVYREFVNYSLTTFVIAFSLGLYLRRKNDKFELLSWSFGIGLSLGGLMISKEDSYWLYPFVLLILLLCIIETIKINQFKENKTKLFLFILPIILWHIPILLVSFQNYRHYDYWGVAENMDKDLNRVVNSIIQIETQDWKPYQPITEETLQKAYSVSPEFSNLEQYLSNSYSGWKYNSDSILFTKPNWYKDKYLLGGTTYLSGNYFYWMFRGALGESGYYANGRYPRESLQLMAEQLEAACKNNTISCNSKTNLPLISTLQPKQYPLVIRFLFDYIKDLISFNSRTPITPLSLDVSTWNPPRSALNYFEQLTYNPIGMSYIGNETKPINGEKDLRFLALHYKEKLINVIFTVYKFSSITLLFPILFLGFLLLLINLSTKNNIEKELIVTLLLMLFVFFLRIGELAIIDASTCVPAEGYIGSSYISLFILGFFFLKFIGDIIKNRQTHKLVEIR